MRWRYRAEPRVEGVDRVAEITTRSERTRIPAEPAAVLDQVAVGNGEAVLLKRGHDDVPNARLPVRGPDLEFGPEIAR